MRQADLMRRHTLEWPILLCLGLVLLALALALATMHLQHHAQHWQDSRQSVLAHQLAEQLQTPEDWVSAAALSRNLSQVEHRTAWLQDPQRARVWHQGPAPKRSGPVQLWFGLTPPIMRWPLQGDMQLVIQAASASPIERKRWRARTLSTLALALLTAGMLTWLLYRLATRRWERLLRWSRTLEQGSLDTAFSDYGLSGQIAHHLGTLARRLWYSRQTLDHFQQDVDLQQRQRIRALQSRSEQLEQTLEELQDQDKARSDLLAGINHELRTPLTGIIGFAELLENTPLNAEQHEYVQTIRRSSSDMVGLISNFLDHQRADAGQLTIHQGQMNPSHVVEDTIALLAPLAYKKGLELTSIVDHDVPAPVLGDAARMRQILTNLVSNAIKFTERGHVLIRLQRISEQGSTVRLRLQVEDTGCGLHPHEQQKLFKAFQRFESDQRPASIGSGLGLSIVRQLSELLGGEITVESAPDHGSTFSVILPFEVMTGARTSAIWEALKGSHIYVYEPHEIVRRALQHQLMFWGVANETFYSLADLRARIQSNNANEQPDLILAGLDSAHINHDELRALCQSSDLKNIAVLGVINSIDSALHAELRQLGLSAILAKSVPQSGLYRSIGECIQDADDPPRKPLQGTQLLVAENNNSSQQYLKTALQQSGAKVLLAADGEQALQLWQQHQPRFVLLDFNMPSLRGDVLTQRIRESDAGDKTVIIGMSAHLSTADERQWYRAGLDSLLVKPFDQAQFLRCIHPWLDTPLSKAQETPDGKALRLVDDQELAGMIAEELPQQMAALDQAFVDGHWEAAREAAHQLHGTAAFFHLEPLKSHVFLLETRLNKDDAPGDNLRLRDDIITLSQDVKNILKTLPGTDSEN